MFDWISGIVASLGYAGVAMLALLEHVFPPIPSELILPLAGYVAASGKLGSNVSRRERSSLGLHATKLRGCGACA